MPPIPRFPICRFIPAHCPALEILPGTGNSDALDGFWQQTEVVLLEGSGREFLKLREHERQRIRDGIAKPPGCRDVLLTSFAVMDRGGGEGEIAFIQNSLAARRAFHRDDAVLQ